MEIFVMIQRIRDSRRVAGEGGFTLIELLVVIVILGILSAVVVFAVGGITDRGEQSACVMDTRTLRTAQEAARARPGGAYLSEADLVSQGLLSEQSRYHDIAAVTASGYNITIQDAVCAGGDATQIGQVVNPAAGRY